MDDVPDEPDLMTSDAGSESDESITDSDSDNEDTLMTQDSVAPPANLDGGAVQAVVVDLPVIQEVDRAPDGMDPRHLPEPTPVSSANVVNIAVVEPEAIIVDEPEPERSEQTNGEDGPLVVQLAGPAAVEILPEAIVVDEPEHTNGVHIENGLQSTNGEVQETAQTAIASPPNSNPPSRGPSPPPFEARSGSPPPVRLAYPPPPPPPGPVQVIQTPDTDEDSDGARRRKRPSRIRKPKKKRVPKDANIISAGRYFQAGEYETAENYYTKAITADPSAPLLYTNRAMARIKLGMFEGVVNDCDESLRLLPHNMKAFYYRCQALYELKQPIEALEAAKKAYELAANSNDHAWERSMGNIVSWVLKCKKAVWEKREAARLRERDPLRTEIQELMQRECEREIADVENESDKEYIRALWRDKLQRVEKVWEASNGREGIRREVPDWMVDDITFAIMHDPVIVSALPFLSFADLFGADDFAGTEHFLGWQG